MGGLALSLTFGFAHKGQLVETIVDDEDAELLGAGSGWYVGSRNSDRLYITRSRLRAGDEELYLHQQVAKRMGLKRKGLRVDHINGDPLDNRRSNIRVVSAARNQQNRRAPDKDSQTGVLGVSHARGGKFRAFIHHEGHQRGLGIHETLVEAAAARRRGELHYRGELAAFWKEGA